MIKLYLSRNFQSKNKEDAIKDFDARKLLNNNKIYCLKYYETEDELNCEEIIGSRLGVLSFADYYVMLDADIPEYGKICEMINAYYMNIPIILIGKNIDNIWLQYYALEIFENLEQFKSWVNS